MVSERVTPGRRDSGAAAVEFALVVPILLALVFGIIDFGIYFADSLAARSGVREGARQGVVLQCPGQSFSMACLKAYTKERIDPIAGGTPYVKITGPTTWKRGENLEVCAVVEVDGVTGLTPLPNGKTIRAKVTMRIEQDQSAPNPVQYEADPLPPEYGTWNDFCT